MEDTNNSENTPFANCVVFTLNQHAWRTTRKVKGDEVSVYATAAIGEDESKKSVDSKLTTVTKKLLDKCAEYKAIGALDTGIRKELESIAVPSAIVRGGSYLVPFASVPKVEEMVREYRTKRTEAVATFISVYPEIVRAIAKSAMAGDGLGALFNATDYPSPEALAERFSVETGYEAFGSAPDTLKRISADLFDREQNRVQKEIRNSVSQVQDAMRGAMLQLVAHLQDRLTDKDDGKRKVLRDSAITNLTEWLALFKDRNVTNDVGLDSLVARAQRVLEGIDPDDLRKSADLRATISSRLAEVNETLSTMVEVAPERTFDWAAEVAQEVAQEAADEAEIDNFDFSPPDDVDDADESTAPIAEAQVQA